MTDPDFASLVYEVRSCTICKSSQPPLPHAPNPVFQFGREARVLIAGQAPGNLADKTQKPFNDPSGVRLRNWLSLSPETFYDPGQVAILPMGFCFPGYDRKGGDLPPRKECALTWRERMLTMLTLVRVTVLIGGYAQAWHLKDAYAGNVTRTVENWRDFAPKIFPVPHPSWRNNAWLKRHPWFKDDLLPELRSEIASALSD